MSVAFGATQAGGDGMIEPKDLRVEVFRSGPAFQPYVSVTVTHLPTGTSASADESSSELRNKALALQELQTLLGIAEATP